MNDLLTVIVPFYCTPHELFSRCVKSVLDNNISNIELLVIDDGSPKEYQKELDSIENDSRARVIHISNSGVSVARNKGIREAKGKWVTFVDSDDYVNQDTLKEITDNLKFFAGEIEIFNGGLDDSDRIIPNTTFLKENFNYGFAKANKIAVLESALSVGILPQGYTCNFSLGAPYCKIFNKDFLISNNIFFDEEVKFAEDTLFSLLSYQHAKNIFYHEKYLYNYVVNMKSVTRKFRPGLSSDMDVFFDRTIKFLNENCLYQDLEKAYYIRVQFETGRCFYLEFFNLQNDDLNAQKAYKEFISREPYKTALKKNYLPHNNYKAKIFNFLVKYGCGNIYNFIRKTRRKFYDI